MDCKRCGEIGAERREVRFQNGSALTVYLCGECVDVERRPDGVSKLVITPDR